MKKLISFLLTAIIIMGCTVFAGAESQKSCGFGEYDSVFIVGIDGAGAACSRN